MDIKTHILVQADQLFCSFGIKSVTMDDIAKHLGISKKTIYIHFRDKNELVEFWIRSMLTEQQNEIDKQRKNSENAVEEVFFAVTHMQALLSKMNQSIFYDLQKYHPSAWLIFKDFRDKYLHQCVSENLKRGIREGHYRDDIHIDILSKMRIEQVEMVFNHAIFPADQYTAVAVMTELTEHFLYGVCTFKGHKQINTYKQINEE